MTVNDHVEAMRAIPLSDVLSWHGLVPKSEGISLRAKTDQYNIVVTGNLWFDNKAGVGGSGAIDLQMHLASEDFPSACRTLATQFRSSPVVQVSPGLHVGKLYRPERTPFPELMATFAVRDDRNWSAARAYLVETRKIEPTVVDELHAAGLIFANNHRPYPSLIFLHRTFAGEIAGASLRDTRPGSSFRPTLGNKRSAWFAVGDFREAQSIVAVESPIDALSYYALFASRNDGAAIVSCSGSTVQESLMHHACERHQRFVVALDNDAAGERGWRKAWDDTADWAGFLISSERPEFKDWNDDLRAAVQAAEIGRAQKPSSLTL